MTTWAARFRRRQSARQSLWLVPLLGALTGIVLAWGAAWAGGRALDMPAALTFTPSTASSVLSAILGAVIGLIGFVVTVTVLLVQTATSQFSARYMRFIYRDRLLKAVLAVLVGTFAYAFVLLRRVGEREAPDLGILIVGGLVLLGILLFLLFFSHLLHRLRPVAVAASVSELGIEAFLELARPTTTGARPLEPPTDVHAVESTRTGTIQAVSLDGLVRWAQDHACTLAFHHGVGDFIHPHATLLEVWGPPPPPDARRDLEGMVALGKERTIEQDPAFAVRVMVDVANRALSAAINDPTTAVQVLDYVEDMLLVIGRSDFSDRGIFCDPDGTPRVVLPSRGWKEYLALGVTEIRQYGGSSTQVVRRLHALLDRLDDHVLPEHRAAVQEELARLEATVRERFEGSVDLDSALAADRQGLGGPVRVAADTTR